eukprot:1159957-Pelagomonas_calceolata.AAC.6
MDLIAIAQAGTPLSKDTYQTLVDQKAIDIPRMAGFDAVSRVFPPKTLQHDAESLRALYVHACLCAKAGNPAGSSKLTVFHGALSPTMRPWSQGGRALV